MTVRPDYKLIARMSNIDKEFTPISCVMIVKNESKNLERCLRSLSWADEIVVLDTGSTDNTPQLAAGLGANVFYLDKWEGFGLARQQAVKYASYDWIMTIDADEVVSAELQKEIIRLKQNGFGEYAYRIKAKSYYLGKAINFCGWQNETHVAIFNKNHGNFNDAEVHESILTSQPIRTLKHYLYHHSYPDMDMVTKKMMLYAQLSGERKFQTNKKEGLFNILFRSFFKFFRMYILKLGFLDGKIGFILCINSAISTYFNHISLWDKIQRNR